MNSQFFLPLIKGKVPCYLADCGLGVVFEEPEDPGSRSFFSEIISSVSDVKFSHNGRYLLTRDYLTAKVWDLNMDKGPVETYQVSSHHLDFTSPISYCFTYQ